MVTDIETATAVVALVVAALVTAGSAAVTRLYWRALARAPRSGGLLLWHVVAISVSVAGCWLTLALGQLDILGILATPRWLRLIGYSVFGLLTVTALGIIGRGQHRRLRQSETVETVITRSQSTVVDD